MPTDFRREAPVRVELTMADLQSDTKLRNSRRKQPIAGSVGAKSVAAKNPERKRSDSDARKAAPLAPGLATVVAAWDTLPDAVRCGIVAMVKAAAGT
jgi:hypothetical protein